jgi:uncharacterized membrane protein YkvA (DUF1232 family)
VAAFLSRLGLFRSLVSHIRLAVRLIREPRVPLTAKAVPAAAALYLISPVDVIPDVLPLLGQVDDLVLLLIALRAFITVCPAPAVSFHRESIAERRPFRPMPDARGGTGHGTVIDAEWRREDDGKKA